MGDCAVDDALDLGHTGVFRDQLLVGDRRPRHVPRGVGRDVPGRPVDGDLDLADVGAIFTGLHERTGLALYAGHGRVPGIDLVGVPVEAHVDIGIRTEEHTSELQSLMRLPYAD